MSKNFLVIKNETEYFVVIHSFPNERGEFNWYLKHGLSNHEKEWFTGRQGESLTVSKEWLDKKNGLFLWCDLAANTDTRSVPCLDIKDNLYDLLFANSFERISFLGSDGNIDSELSFDGKDSKYNTEKVKEMIKR